MCVCVCVCVCVYFLPENDKILTGAFLEFTCTSIFKLFCTAASLVAQW